MEWLIHHKASRASTDPVKEPNQHPLELWPSNLVLVLGPMSELEVNVHKGPLDFWELLQLLLEGLADIVCLIQEHVFRQDDVHLHEVVGSERVGPHGVDVSDLFVVVPGEIGQLRNELRWGRSSYQQPHVLYHRLRPSAYGVHGYLHRQKKNWDEDILSEHSSKKYMFDDLEEGPMNQCLLRSSS